MYSKVNYTLVGLFVVVFTIGMVWFAFWLAKYGLKDEYYTYKIEMTDSIAGLSKDSSVKLHGVDVGRVSKIRIDPKDITKINVFVDIDKKVTIKDDMVASTQMLGVTGLLSIEIHGGTNASKTLRPTETFIPLIKSRPSLLSKLTHSLDGLSENLTSLLERGEALLSDKNIENVTKILDHVEKVSAKGEDVEDQAIVSLHEVDSTLQAFRVTMQNMNQKFTEVSKDFNEIKGVTVPMVESVENTSKSFNRTTLKFEKSLDRGDYDLKKMLEPVLVDIQILSSQLNSMAKGLTQSPSELLFKSRASRRGPGE